MSRQGKHLGPKETAALEAAILSSGSIKEAAEKTGIYRGTVARHANRLRAEGRMGLIGVPTGAAAPEKPVAKPVLPASHHATARASALEGWIHSMLASTLYPVINPEAVVVEPVIGTRYDRVSGHHVDSERAPRTWVSDALKVAPVADPRGRTFIFTGAQNDAQVHEGFWENLQAFAEHVGAEIVVGAWTYETAWFNENSTTARSYDPRILPHIAYGQMAIGDDFVFCGEMNTLPTASQPISNLVTYSRGKWAVFPHAKIQLKSVPSTDPDVQAHQIMTTGAVTLPKVIPRKAGIRSIFHHIIGAVIVEFDEDGDVFPRQINASEDGSFYELDRFVSNGVVTTGHSVEAIVCADIHERKLDHANALATFGFGTDTTTTYRDNLIDVLRPKKVMVHDVFDNETRSHHHVGDSAYSYEMAIRGRDSVLDEVRAAAEFIARVRRPGTEPVVIESNHDLGLERYVREGRYRNDGGNVRYGLQLEEAYMAAREQQVRDLDSGARPDTFSLFEHAARLASGTALDGVQWVHDGQSFLIDEVECGHHGFRGANGAKGTVSGFAKIGRKMTIADKHSPEILDGVYVAGAMNLKHGYNRGPSGWAVSHVIQYPNSKRCIVTLQKGKWRAKKPRLRVQAGKSSDERIAA